MLLNTFAKKKKTYTKIYYNLSNFLVGTSWSASIYNEYGHPLAPRRFTGHLTNPETTFKKWHKIKLYKGQTHDLNPSSLIMQIILFLSEHYTLSNI